MPVAEIIAIGTELLLGEIQDTNTQYLARHLRDHGIDLYRTTIVGDNIERVARVIQESSSRSEIVITTGGLGPTVDDPTRQAVALSQNVDLVYLDELWAQIETRFKQYHRQPTENNRRQAYIPAGAIPVENPVGTAPCFIIDQPEYCIISLPGVPREMEYLIDHAVLPYLQKRFQLKSIIKARVLHTAGIGESQVDEWVSDLEVLKNPTVGLLAHAGQVDIRITAKADSESEADRLIETLAADIYSRLGDNIYGEDHTKLENIVIEQLERQSTDLLILQSGLDPTLTQKLVDVGFPEANIQDFEKTHQTQETEKILEKAIRLQGADAGLAVILENHEKNYQLTMIFKSPQKSKTSKRSFGGVPELVYSWAANASLDFLRRNS